jgi:erythromycin esterase
VEPGLYRLHGTDPDLPTDDLEPLILVTHSARFVGLGESIHTNGGFYEMKHRVFRSLVHAGFRAFGFETPWVAAESAREYVESCEGSSEEALDSLFTVWNSTQTRDLLEWMCQWNRLHADDPVHFYGFDIQNQGDRNTTPLIEFLEQLDYVERFSIIEGIRVCDGAEDSYYPYRVYPEELYDQCQAALDEAERLFDEKELEIARATSTEALAWARVHLISVRAFQEEMFFIDSDWSRGFAARDRGMALVAAAIRQIRFPHARVALWAHNGHIMKDGPSSSMGTETMGTFLDETFGHFYVAIALTAYETYLEWPWIGLCGGPYILLGNNPVEVVLYRTGEQNLFVDFDPSGTLESLFAPNTVYSIGGTSLMPARQFDGLIYLERAPAMDPLFNSPHCP